MKSGIIFIISVLLIFIVLLGSVIFLIAYNYDFNTYELDVINGIAYGIENDCVYIKLNEHNKKLSSFESESIRGILTITERKKTSLPHKLNESRLPDIIFEIEEIMNVRIIKNDKNTDSVYMVAKVYGKERVFLINDYRIYERAEEFFFSQNN